MYRDAEFFFFFFCGIFGRKDSGELEREGRGRSFVRTARRGRVNGEEDSSIAVVDKIVKGV